MWKNNHAHFWPKWRIYYKSNFKQKNIEKISPFFWLPDIWLSSIVFKAASILNYNTDYSLQQKLTLWSVTVCCSHIAVSSIAVLW